MVDIPFDATAGIAPAEVGEVELYHPKSWWTQYVFSQDAKVIAIQYSITAMSIGMVALVLSWLMRLQLGFPGSLAGAAGQAVVCPLLRGSSPTRGVAPKQHNKAIADQSPLLKLSL
jgi:hypothetical protein